MIVITREDEQLEDEQLEDEQLEDEQLEDEQLEDEQLEDEQLKDEQLKDEQLEDEQLEDELGNQLNIFKGILVYSLFIFMVCCMGCGYWMLSLSRKLNLIMCHLCYFKFNIFSLVT